MTKEKVERKNMSSRGLKGGGETGRRLLKEIIFNIRK